MVSQFRSSWSFLFFLMIFILGAFPLFAAEFSVFNKTYIRSSGSPVSVEDAFGVLNPNTTWTLKAINGDLEDQTIEKVSSSTLYLNDEEILRPNDFQQDTLFIEEPVALGVINQVRTQVKGKPGGQLIVYINGVDNTAPTAQWNLPLAGQILNTATVSTQLSLSDDIAGINPVGVQITLDGISVLSNYTLPSGPALSVLLNADLNVGEGMHTLNTQFSDMAGLTASCAVSFLVDMTPPVIDDVVPVDGSLVDVANPVISAVFQDNLSGVNPASVQVLLNSVDRTAQAAITTGGFTLTPDPLPDGAYTLTVRVRDAVGNLAQVVSSFTILTDTEPPAVPAGFSANGGNTVVDLSWTPNTEPDLEGYNLYRASVSGGPYTKINTALISTWAYQDTGLANDQEYFYVITSVDQAGNESTHSTEVVTDTGVFTGPTYVSGQINVDTTWDRFGAPYIVTGNISLNGGITLTVKRATEIRFAGDYEFDVWGTLQVVGQAGREVRFTSNQAAAVKGDWYRIHFRPGSDSSVVDHAIMEYAKTAVYLPTGASVTIRNSQIRHNNYGVQGTGSSLRLENNTLANNTTGIELLSGAPVITNNVVQNNSDGIRILYDSSAVLSGNIIVNNTNHGIYLQQDPVQPMQVRINNNTIRDNSVFNLYSYQGDPWSGPDFSWQSIDAKGNWWGTTDAVNALNKIHDVSKNPKAASVDISSILDGPGGNPINERYVHGYINADSVWRKIDSPYILIHHMTVRGGTLTVEPGVEIRFAGSFGFTVNGGLNAQGTVGEKIKITSHQAVPAAGDWYGFTFADGGSHSILSYATVEYSQYGIRIQNSAARIEHNIVHNNVQGISAYHGSAEIKENQILNNTYCGICLEQTSSTLVKDNTITSNLHGIYVSGNSPADLITENMITNNAKGITVQPNGNGPIMATVYRNSLLNNTDYDLFAAGPGGFGDYSDLFVQAENNWWGVSDPAVIRTNIYDRHNNAGAPEADFEPFLYGPDGQPVVTEVSIMGSPFFNPRNGGEVTAQYTLSSEAYVTMNVHNWKTKALVRQVTDPLLKSIGTYTMTWDGKDGSGNFVPPGAYVFFLQTTNDFNQTGGYSPFYIPGSVQMTNAGITSGLFDPYKGQRAEITYNLVTPGFVRLRAGVANTSDQYQSIIDYEPRNVIGNKDYWDGRGSSGNMLDRSQDFVVYGWVDILPENAMVVTGESTLTVDMLRADPYAVYPLLGGVSQIGYAISQDATVTVEIKSSNGSSVIRTLVSGEFQSMGPHMVIWDALDDEGKVVKQNGDYRVRISAVDGNGTPVIRETALKVIP
jgi:parallel beta-helix repeat protein